MAALEQASAYGDIQPLAKVFADQVRGSTGLPEADALRERKGASPTCGEAQ